MELSAQLDEIVGDSAEFCRSLCNKRTRNLYRTFGCSLVLVRALYRFHTYYHVRRILYRIRAPTPSQEGFDKYNNVFSLEEVRRVGNEYGCSTENLSISRNQYFFNKSGRGSHNNWSRWIISSYHLNRRRDTALLGMELKLQQLRRFLLIILRMLSIRRTLLKTTYLGFKTS